MYGDKHTTKPDSTNPQVWGGTVAYNEPVPVPPPVPGHLATDPLMVPRADFTRGVIPTTGIDSKNLNLPCITPPSLINIGFERAGIEQFSDLKHLTEHPGPYKISQVKVQWNKDCIIGVRFSYCCSDNECIDGYDITKFKPFNELFGQVNKETFKIDKDDELLEIFGRVGTHINKLGFRTYKGHVCEYGLDMGQHFSYKFPGFTFGPMAGGYGEYLDFLVLLTQPLQEKYCYLKNLIPPM